MDEYKNTENEQKNNTEIHSGKAGSVMYLEKSEKTMNIIEKPVEIDMKEREQKLDKKEAREAQEQEI